MNKPHVYITLGGVEVSYGTISLVEINMARAGVRQDFNDRKEPVAPPTYTVKLGPDGQAGEQTFLHNETTLETAEDREKWAAHIDALDRLEYEQNKLMAEIILEDAVFVQLPADESWIEKQKRRHIRIPEDLSERRLHYLMTVILKTQDDIQGLVSEVLKLSARGTGAEAAIDAALESFRNRLPAKQEERGQIPSGDQAKEEIAVGTLSQPAGGQNG